MFKALTLKAAVRRAVVVGAVLGATVAAQATVLTYTSQLLAGVNTGTQADHLSIPQFNPSWGTLVSVTVSYANFAYSESSLTNLTSVTRVEVQNSFASDNVSVTSGAISVGGGVSASTSYGPGPIAGGATNDLIDQQFSGGGAFYTSAFDLAQFTGLGNVFVDNATVTSGQFGQQGNYYGFSFNIGEGQAQVSYNYTNVPSPAAAATMLIGVVGGLVRRRKSA